MSHRRGHNNKPLPPDGGQGHGSDEKQVDFTHDKQVDYHGQYNSSEKQAVDSSHNEKQIYHEYGQQSYTPGVPDTDEIEREYNERSSLEEELDATASDLEEARQQAMNMSLDEVRVLMTKVLKVHESDPNFPHTIIMKIRDFLADEDIFEHPEKHQDIIYQMSVEAALITNNSPYAEVRAVVENKDDPSLPSSTLRAWVLGLFFCAGISCINQLFSVRLPGIAIAANVAQLLSYPLGKAWELLLPDWGFTILGERFSLNPGPFNKKEHMLIVIMAHAADVVSLPLTLDIVWTQVLPGYFNQEFAKNFAYQILNALATQFIGFGLAGIIRRCLVYPSFCIWPENLVTIAMNRALHRDANPSVLGPFNKRFSMSRYRFFMYAFIFMFVYFWFPGYIMSVLSYFSWMTWISPTNANLELVTGFINGLSLFNPIPTFDWNIVTIFGDPLYIPAFSTFNKAGGWYLFSFLALAFYCTNAFHTGRLPILSGQVYDHFGMIYNVSRSIDEHGMYDDAKYMDYSAAYISAGFCVYYFCFFGLYAATITYVFLFHWYELKVGFRGVWKDIIRPLKRGGEDDDDELYQDVHARLIGAYKEAPNWWFICIFILSIGLGIIGITIWPTYTTWGVVPFGVFLAIIFVVPVGMIRAITGIPIYLNVIAEFIGGSWVPGNALAMNYFKTYGQVTCFHAVNFSSVMKLGQYVKIPPRHTVAAQLISTLISTFIATGMLNWQVNLEGICTAAAPMRLTCPSVKQFFTASVLWGVVGPIKVFSPTGQYGALLLGFPIGFVSVIVFYALTKWRVTMDNRFLRQVHPVLIWTGGIYLNQFSFGYQWTAVPVAYLSWRYIKPRFLAFWSKYNYVLSSAFAVGIAISGIIQFFTVSWLRVHVDWWGNTQLAAGCEGDPTPCIRYPLAEGERFYPWWDTNLYPAA